LKNANPANSFLQVGAKGVFQNFCSSDLNNSLNGPQNDASFCRSTNKPHIVQQHDVVRRTTLQGAVVERTNDNMKIAISKKEASFLSPIERCNVQWTTKLLSFVGVNFQVDKEGEES